MRQIARVQYERGPLGRYVDLRDRGAQRGGHIRVRGLVETDMAVADLDESKAAAHAGVVTHRVVRRALERHALENTARERPHSYGTDPGHALQKPPAIEVQSVVLLRHRIQLLVIGPARRGLR